MKCVAPLYIKPNVVPCGKCNYCRQLRMLDWSFRLRNELQYSSSAFFVTLTLRVTPKLGVWKPHVQGFFKRLRKQVPDQKIVYYAVAEYGKRTMRPHYHAIIFNASSDAIIRSWKRGHVHIGSVTDKSINYVANYSLKGTRYPSGCRRPFALMSRRPAIGSKYLETHGDWHRSGKRSYTMVNGIRGHLPRFYRDRIFSEDDRMLMNMENRAKATDQFKKEFKRVSKLHPQPSSYMILRDKVNCDMLVKKFEKNETI